MGPWGVVYGVYENDGTAPLSLLLFLDEDHRVILFKGKLAEDRKCMLEMIESRKIRTLDVRNTNLTINLKCHPNPNPHTHLNDFARIIILSTIRRLTSSIHDRIATEIDR